MKKCKDCKWLYDVTPTNSELPPLPQYECRRYAPQILHGSGTGWSDKKWPTVKQDDWCGEFEAEAEGKE